MFKPTKAKSVQEYLDSIGGDRQQDILFLHEFIQKTVPELKVHFAYNMIGYGSFPYLNYKKETIQWPILAMASQKNYISVYVCAMHEGKYIAEAHKDKLGKVSVGKSCIRFKKPSDVNLDELAKVIKQAAKAPGLR